MYNIEKPFIKDGKWIVFPNTTVSDIDTMDCNDTMAGECYNNKSFKECVRTCEKSPECNFGYFISNTDDINGKDICVPLRDRNVNSNPCGTCGTKSGYSEFRYGLFTIIPAAAIENWGDNFDAITEYARRKLVAKVFCGGIANYKFIDNWLTGSLYMFPFKAKVRWDDEATLDLNVRRTKYCPDLVYFKAGTVENPDKRFYYRS